MQAFELNEVVEQQTASGGAYLEFLRESALSMGVYHLPVNGHDAQQPHTEDEVYYIAGGVGMIRVGDEDRTVTTGSIVVVAANVPHHFHSITQALVILVFFAPAEYANNPTQSEKS